MSALEGGVISERIIRGGIRLTLGVILRFALRAQLALGSVKYDRNVLIGMLNNPGFKIMRYSSNVSLSQPGLINLEIHIDNSAELQKNPSRPLRITLQSFWLRRGRVRDYFMDFLREEGLTYETIESGELSIFEYLEHAALFQGKQFASIQKTGSETGTILIPGGKDDILASLLISGLSPVEIAHEYNQLHGLRGPS